MRKNFVTVGMLMLAWGSARADNSEQLMPGMTEREVVRMMGPASVVKLERNGVLCFAYEPYERRHTNFIFVRDALIVAFHAGILVSTESARSSDIDHRCSQIAAGWDSPEEHAITCFRKFWLRCP